MADEEQNKKTVLYVDDDPEQLELYRMAFAAHAPEIDFYTEQNPYNSLVRICTLKPDIVLLDLVMTEDMSGMDVAKMIKTDFELRNVRVIAFTNSMASKVTKELNELGITEIWEKIKMTPHGVVEKVQGILAGK